MRVCALIYNILTGPVHRLSDNTALILPVRRGRLHPDPAVLHIPCRPNHRIALKRFILPSRLIGTVTAVALALTAFTAAPAHADRDRNTRIAATVLGLAVEGALIHENNKDKREQSRKPRTVTKNHSYVQHRPAPHRVNRNVLPQNCLRSYQTRQGQAHMFGRRCLEKNYRAAHRLPQNCAIQVRTDRGLRGGYDARCLRRNGYSFG